MTNRSIPQLKRYFSQASRGNACARRLTESSLLLHDPLRSDSVALQRLHKDIALC